MLEQLPPLERSYRSVFRATTTKCSQKNPNRHRSRHDGHKLNEPTMKGESASAASAAGAGAAAEAAAQARSAQPAPASKRRKRGGDGGSGGSGGEAAASLQDEAAGVRCARRSLEAVDTALQSMLSDLKVLGADYERMASATRGWAAIVLGQELPRLQAGERLEVDVPERPDHQVQDDASPDAARGGFAQRLDQLANSP